MDGRQVVTVYVKDLPIVSFVEQPGLEPPLLRASTLVARLNQMAQGSLKDTTIALAWAEPQSGDPLYAVQVNGEELLRIDGECCCQITNARWIRRFWLPIVCAVCCWMRPHFGSGPTSTGCSHRQGHRCRP